MTSDRILVSGAGGALGFEIVRILRAQGRSVLATMRTSRPGVEEALSSLGADVARLDVTDEKALAALLEGAGAAIFTPILSVSQNASVFVNETVRAVFFSSNNVAIAPEAPVYARLFQAEAAVALNAPHAVILRPTMIYGYPGDGNMSRLMALMKRSPAIPMPGSGTALQQPVYYKDLARITVAKLLDETASGVFAVAGPQAVSQKDVCASAARAVKANPITVPIPTGAAAAAIGALERLGLKLPVSAAQLARAGRDKIPAGAPVILTETTLDEGLAALAQALDGEGSGA